MTDPIPLFSGSSPIPLVLLNHLLESLLSGFPGYPGAAPGRQAELRLVAMLMLAAFNPQDAAQAMLAASAVTARVHGTECLRLTADPALKPDVARRYTSLGTSLLRHYDQVERRLERIQVERRKARQPLDARAAPTSSRPQPAGPPSPAAAPSANPCAPMSAVRQDPMPSGLPPASPHRPDVPDASRLPRRATDTGARPSTVARVLDPGKSKALQTMAQAAAKEAVARAMQRGAAARP